MTSKEKAIICLNEAIYCKKKLNKRQKEELIILRESIRKTKTKKGVWGIVKKIAKLFGINVDALDDDEN
jgi:hypothetical protein